MPQWGTTTYPLDSLKFERLTIWNVSNFYTFLGVYKGTITLKSSLEVSYKVKYTVIMWPSNTIPKYLPKRKENIQLPRYCTLKFIAVLIIIAKN